MSRLPYFLTALILAVCSTSSWAGKTIEVRTSMNDTFRISETDNWKVKVERQLTLRFANVRVDDKRGYPFSLMLYFKADTPDIAQFDTPEKIARAIEVSSEKYLSIAVEKGITLQKIPVDSTYGYFTVITDARVVNMPQLPPREFIYITRGMLRISKDSALGFSLLTNDIDSDDYRKVLDYVYSFVKPGVDR